jgi:hypothetical protein
MVAGVFPIFESRIEAKVLTARQTLIGIETDASSGLSTSPMSARLVMIITTWWLCAALH